MIPDDGVAAGFPRFHLLCACAPRSGRRNGKARTRIPRTVRGWMLFLAGLPLIAQAAQPFSPHGKDTGATAGRPDPAFYLSWKARLSPALFSSLGGGDTLSGRKDPDTTEINWNRAAIVGGALTATVVGLHIYQSSAWWKDQRRSFHIEEDPAYAQNVDKVGHFFGGAFSAFVGRKSSRWTGFSEESSVWIGTAIGALFELYVEFEDGFAGNWGFSPGDAYGDLAGAFFPVLQYYVKPLGALQPQFQYWPSTEMREGRHPGGIFIDDYDGQTYWMAVHVAEILPAKWRSWWPDWLGLAVGVSLRNKKLAEDLNDETLKRRNVLIALDYDWRHILPGEGWFMRALKEGLNFLHFPSPAIRISPGVVAYGLYFSQ